MAKTIDLGKKYGEEMAASKPMDSKKVSYPTLYISGVDDLSGIEGEFTFTAKGKVVSCTESTRDGKTNYSCELEVHSITPQGKAKKDSGESLDEAMDTIAADKEAEVDPSESEEGDE